MQNPSVAVSQKNPMCGDEIYLQLNIENNKIADAKFDGAACMISIVSSSLLTQTLKGKTIKEVKNISKDNLLEMLGINLTTSRIKCATLVLEALTTALNKYEK